jgi:hypothetical protein
MKSMKIISTLTLLLIILSFIPAATLAQPSCYNWEDITTTVSGRPPADGYMPIYDSESDVILYTYSSNKTMFVYDATSNTFTSLSCPTMPDQSWNGYWQQYDEKNDVVILFGGILQDDPDGIGLDETWAYDYNTNTWTNMSPPVSPPARTLGFMTYDSNVDKMLLFGGVRRWSSPWIFYNDVWAYDYALNNWTNVTPTVGLYPEARFGHYWSFDPILNKTLLFGGSTDTQLPNWNILDDMWIYDLGSTTWTEIFPINKPSERVYTDMVYDSNASKTILFGGSSSTPGILPNDYLDDLWIFDSQTLNWFSTVCVRKPSARMITGLVFHSKLNKTFLYGAANDLVYLNDFWVLTYDENCDCWIPEFSELASILLLITLPSVAVIAMTVKRKKKA